METQYNLYRQHIKTGDPIFFEGKGVSGFLIRLGNRLSGRKSRKTHIGMAYWIGDVLMIIESTSLYQDKNGVQINLLSQRIKTYNGHVSVRHIVKANITSIMLDQLDTTIKVLRGRPYEKEYIELIGAALDRTIFNEETEKSLLSIFCSELIATIWKMWKLLPKEKPANEYTPADFETVKLLKGSLSREMYLC